MSDGDKLPRDFAVIDMDGPLVLINMLMGACRRSAIQSLGGACDAHGDKREGSADIPPNEIRDLMVKLCAQGFMDAMSRGMLGNIEAKTFAVLVAEELAEIAKRQT